MILVLIVLFVITSANSATFVPGMFTAKGVLQPKRRIRFGRGLAQILVAGVLLKR
jgi:glycine betaine transporter